MLMNERIRRYVKRKYVANGEAPTVRDVSKAVGISQDDVQGEVDGDPECEMLLSSHDWDGSIGAAYVELYATSRGTEVSRAMTARSKPFVAEFDDGDGRGFWVIEHPDAEQKFEVSRAELAALERLVKGMRRLVRPRRRRATPPTKET